MQFRTITPIPLVLIAISLIPIVAGLARLAQIAGAPIELMHTPRVTAGPHIVFVAHITAAIVFLSLGAFQFSSGPNPARRQLHRIMGRIAVVAALVTGASAIWLTIYFPHASHDGTVLNVIRIAAGCAIVISTTVGFIAARDRRISDHRKWMMRAYALASATGVQAFVIIVWQLAFENPAGLTRAFIFGGCWCACLLFVEVRLHRTRIQSEKGTSK